MGISLFGTGYIQSSAYAGYTKADTLSSRVQGGSTAIFASGETSAKKVTPSGTTDPTVLANAPSPLLNVAGKDTKAKYVVDLSSNTLYRYDSKGNPIAAYLIASGKKSTPTSTGVRMISHVETFPYRNAPRSSKRRRHPYDYGPKILILRKVDSETGETYETGEFIHGNNNYNSLGKYASHGCMRMDNEVIKELAAESQRGDYVLIIK